MKNKLINFCLLIFSTSLAFSQNDRNILKYSITNKKGETYHLTYTIISINNNKIILHWESPEKGEGNISLLSSAWRNGTRGFWSQPLSGSAIELDNDQTIASFSQNFYNQIKNNGRAQYDGIEYFRKKEDNTRRNIGSRSADIIFLESKKGNVKAWMLDNEQVPLIIKITGFPSGCDMELEDIGTFFFWQEVRNYKTLTVPEIYVSGKEMDYPGKDNLNHSRYKNATDFLPENYVRDGTKDYTEYLQACLDANKLVIMPDFPVLVNDGGLNVRDNQTIFFQRKSQLLLKPSDKQHYEMLRIKNVKNVTILNANLVGDRERHLSAGGEWGMGISITGSQKVTIKNALISNCWGDGIYVGRLKKLAKNIRIEGCRIDNVRRNGLSVISAVNLKVTNCVFANTNGTDPQSGVDIEPNNTRDVLKKINFENNITFNNKHSGLLIYLNESPRKDKSQKVTININNNFDDNSLNPVRISGFFLGDMNKFKPIKGWIKIKNLKSKDNKPGIMNKTLLFPPVIME